MATELSSTSPPPWQLHGDGLVALYPPAPERVSPQDQAAYRGGPSALMLVRYAHSDVGPYDELLYVAGFFQAGPRVRPRVTRILVSSAASAVWGRRNWGLPKELAQFEWEESMVRVWQGGAFLAQLAWQATGPALLLSSRLLPSRFGTLAQPTETGFLLTRPQAHGWAQPARLTCATVESELFPDLNAARPLASVWIERFQMVFPVPERT